MTGPEKTGLIYTKYTYSYYGAYLFSVHAIHILLVLLNFTHIIIMKFVLKCYQDEILHFKDQNLGQNLHVDKTCFLRPGHIRIVTHTYVAASCQHLSGLPMYICMCASHSCFLNSVYIR